MRRPRAGTNVPPLPGGPGQPSDPTKGVCLEWLDAVWRKGGESRPDQGLAQATHPHPEVTAPGTEKPRWSAERRPHPSKEDAARRKDPVRHSVLRPLDLFEGEKRDDGVPGAAKNTGDGACSIESWLFEN